MCYHLCLSAAAVHVSSSAHRQLSLRWRAGEALPRRLLDLLGETQPHVHVFNGYGEWRAGPGWL